MFIRVPGLDIRFLVFHGFLGGGWKFSLYTLEFNKLRCTHFHDYVITTYYSNPNPNHKKVSKCGSRNLNPNPKVSISPKRQRIAALGLALGFLD